MAEQHTLSDYLLNVSLAEQGERWHQETCRARADDRPCRSCLDWEADWLAAEQALDAFLTAQREQVA